MIEGLLQWGYPYIQKTWIFYDVFVFDFFDLKKFVQICLNGCFAENVHLQGAEESAHRGAFAPAHVWST